MFDETTDVSTIEQMVIHGRYVNDLGEVTTNFLKIMDCLESDGPDEDEELRLNAAKFAKKVTSYNPRQKEWDKSAKSTIKVRFIG